MQFDVAHFLRRYLLPPAAYDTLQRLRPSGTKMPFLWDGEPLSNVQSDHAFAGSAASRVQFVTRGDEGRICVECKSGDEFEIGSFEQTTPSLQFAFVSLQPSGIVRDLVVKLNGRTVVDLRGKLPADKWTDALVPGIGAAGTCKISVQYRGQNSIAFANPIVSRPKRKKTQNNIVMLVLDSLMPEQLGCYQGLENGNSPTPYIDAFFGDHLRFNNAYSQGEWTLSSMSSMMTGLYGIQHGNYNPNVGSRTMPPQIPTLAESLRAKGYRTFGYSTGRRFVPTYGHYRGFDRFFYSDWHKPSVGKEIINSAIEFMASAEKEPFFCLLHFYDPHPPFGDLSYYSSLKSPPDRWVFPGDLHGHWKHHQEDTSLVDDLARYSNIKTSQLDLWLNNLFAYLRDSGLDASTTTFLLSDHGREYYKKVPLLTDDRVSVPLLIRGPGTKSKINNDFVEPGVDLYPTILRLAGLSNPDHVVGNDLIAPTGLTRDLAKSESLYNGVYEIALRSKKWCYVYKCKMDSMSGEIHTGEKLGEFLYTHEDDRNNNYIDTSKLSEFPNVVKKFRVAMEEHCRKSPRYFDKTCLIPMG